MGNPRLRRYTATLSHPSRRARFSLAFHCLPGGFDEVQPLGHAILTRGFAFQGVEGDGYQTIYARVVFSGEDRVQKPVYLRPAV